MMSKQSKPRLDTTKAEAGPAIINGKRNKTSVKKRPEPPFPLFGKDKTEPPSFSQGLKAVADLLRGRKNIIVLTGAGISVSSGIPDFRSKNVGLYETLDTEVCVVSSFAVLLREISPVTHTLITTQELGLSCAEELFDLSFFQENPVPFYKFARRLYFPTGSRTQRVQPSDAHKLLALLDQKKMLLRVYSQNIDGLEQDAGVSPKRIVYAHGSLQWATCQQCKQKVGLSELEEDIWAGRVAKCAATTKKEATGGGGENVSRKRTRDSVKSTAMRTRGTTHKESRCGGVFKPGVTFFGEVLGDKVARCLEADCNKVDALIVIGTSLSV